MHRAHDVFDLAATLTSGIVRNHPFIDGNKRVGFIVGVLFLELNGHRFNATQQDATRAVIALAAGACNEAEYRAFLAANSAQREPSR
ncbi:MAG: type II toxin-antitoxin system death-on-curing family toxin [Gammaproteobacteria bacterium]|nr:type II toxin-antitoxin system death-on-curing family toxin [Gammaproteobacteria bacterium]